MKILNLGCGGVRPASPDWVNLDDLHAQLAPGTEARRQLDGEPNYLNHTIHPSRRLPFDTETFDGILASHFFEHFDAQDCLKVMKECRRILKPDGVLLISVPDASYFRKVHHEDRNENWPRLFGVTDPKNPIPTWMEAALFFEQHKLVFTEDSLWCFLTQAGLTPVNDSGFHPPTNAMKPHLNRSQFSLEILATK